jgi:hypothetical protein
MILSMGIKLDWDHCGGRGTARYVTILRVWCRMNDIYRFDGKVILLIRHQLLKYVGKYFMLWISVLWFSVSWKASTKYIITTHASMEENRLISSSFIHFDTLTLLKAADKAYTKVEKYVKLTNLHTVEHIHRRKQREIKWKPHIKT